MEPIKKFEPVKPFEPLKPFEPIKPFEPLKPFEAPKSFELAKQIQASKTAVQEETTNATVAENEQVSEPQKEEGQLPVGYTPVVPLEPFKPFEAIPPDQSSEVNGVSKSNEAEIEEGKAKSTLKEIISEIDSYAEKDRELKSYEQVFKSNGIDIGNDKVGRSQIK